MKQLLKSAIAFCTFCALCCLTFTISAQDSTSVATGSSGFSLPSWFGIAAGIVVGIYELLVRYIPTTKNYSIIGFIIKLIQTLIPNNNSQTPTSPHS